MSKQITIESKRYEDQDDCLTAAAEEFAADHGLDSWQVKARWAEAPGHGDGTDRDHIVLTVPDETIRKMAIALAQETGIVDGTGTLYTVCEQAIIDGDDAGRVRQIWTDATVVGQFRI